MQVVNEEKAPFPACFVDAYAKMVDHMDMKATHTAVYTTEQSAAVVDFLNKKTSLEDVMKALKI